MYEALMEIMEPRIKQKIVECQVAINIPDDVLFDTKVNREEANPFARCDEAMGYYTQNGVSTGYCAQIAGLSVEEFIRYLGRNHDLHNAVYPQVPECL